MGSKAVSPERESFTHPAHASSLVKQAARHLGVSRSGAFVSHESERRDGCQGML